MHALTRSQAGLFSAVTSAFILDVQSQLQPDTGDETVALLRVLIYKIDNTTFSDNAPAIPQWVGPPHAIVQVQTMLYASLAASLFSAFLAMLGKQWLNRYASTELRGTAIERSQNRQRKLDGIVAWYFDHVMESLPLMLQVALLLLGCALSRYLWKIDTTVASVVLGVTSAGLAFYMFITAAGAAFESCPYQTPGSNALRYLLPKVQRILYPIALAFRKSNTARVTREIVQYHLPWWPRGGVTHFLRGVVFYIPRAFVLDVCNFGRAAAWKLLVVLVSLGRRVRNRPRGATRTPEQSLDQRATALELRCILWMLRTSLDKAVHLSILEYLATMVTLADFDPALVMDCFNAFLGCVKVDVENHEVAITQGLERLANVSALTFFNTVSHLLVIDPTSRILKDVRQRYLEVFPLAAGFHDLRSYHAVLVARCLLVRWWERRTFQWSDYKPSTHEFTLAATIL